MTADIGLFPQHGYHVKYLKGYLAIQCRTYSFRKFISLRPQAIPQSWNYAPNVRGLLPTSQAVVYPDSDTSTEINSKIDHRDSSNFIPLGSHKPSTTIPTYPQPQSLSYTQWPLLPGEHTRATIIETNRQDKTLISSLNQEGEQVTDPQSDQEGDIGTHIYRPELNKPSTDPKATELIKLMVREGPQSEPGQTVTEVMPQSVPELNTQSSSLPQTISPKSLSIAHPLPVSKYG